MFAIGKTRAEKGVWAMEIAPPPPPGPDEVQVRVTHAGVCGTDFHMYNWDAWSAGRVKPPRVIGHEFVGVIEAVGSHATRFEVGQRVSAECHVVCGVCRFCRTGRGHLCPETEIIGVDRDGIFTGLVNIPASNIWPVHPDIPDHHAAIFDPFGNAMHAVMVEPIAGKDVLITGAGPIGLMSVAIAKTFGARHVSVLEPKRNKRELALKLGADLALDPTDENQISQIRKQEPPQVLLEMSGSEAAIHSGLALLENGGAAVLLGLPPRPITLDLSEEVIFRGLRLHGVIGRKMFETWFEVEAFMRANPEAVEAVITHQLPAGDFEKAFTLMENGEAAKVVLAF